MPRMLFFACLALSLVLTGCGSKELEPYQSPTAPDGTRTTTKTTTTKTRPGYASFVDGDGNLGNILEETVDGNKTGEEDSIFDDLPGTGTLADSNTPVVESLDAGSGTGDQLLGFDKRIEDKSDAYKREHGRSSRQMQPVYFDFDKSTIRADQISHIEHNADYLKSNMAGKVLIEGNCDEFGTNEYNLALGERRAMSAKKYLIKLGVAGSRIRTVSYGEERPLFIGSEESDYAYNRRADFVLE
ncbi:MAG: peptidoglycan-associated lipoprotein Pal [Candidatus Electrothrix sp. YB6]